VSKFNTGSLPLCGILPVKTSKKQTAHFRTYNRRALRDLPQTLHGDRFGLVAWRLTALSAQIGYIVP